jgi:hypothetical protein
MRSIRCILGFHEWGAYTRVGFVYNRSCQRKDCKAVNSRPMTRSEIRSLVEGMLLKSLFDKVAVPLLVDLGLKMINGAPKKKRLGSEWL